MDDFEFCSISDDVKLGQNVKLSKFINLYGCSIGHNTRIGASVEVQKNAHIGNNCKISSHTFICEGVTIEDDVFVGHGVMFINDTYPRATETARLRQSRTGPSSPPWSKRERPSVLTPPSSAISPSARMPSWGQEAWSRRTSPPM